MNEPTAPSSDQPAAPASPDTPAAPTGAGASRRPPATRAPRARAGATLADASGAQALLALGRELRQARGLPADAAAAPEVTDQTPPARAASSRPPARSNPGQRSKRLSRQPTRQNRAPGAAAVPAGEPAKPTRPLHPVLQQLRTLYPQLFGEQPLPLKRGIYHDLVAAHPAEVLDPAGLKVALGLHTRSSRYLNAVARGLPRHALDGSVVEAMAPEHVHHALLEVFRRRKPRDGEDLGQTLRRRIAHAFETSGLTREAYDLLVRGRNAQANAALDDALAEVAQRDAKAEALRRAFEASGQSLEEFARTYGVPPQAVQQALARCAMVARRKSIPAPTEASATATPADAAPPPTDGTDVSEVGA